MKIDVPLTTDLGLGAQRRIIEPGDSVAEIPSTINPVVAITSPHVLAAVSNVAMNSSFVSEFLEAKNNAAAFVDTMVTLAPGLWDLTISFTFSMTITTAQGIGQRIRISVVDGVFTLPIFEILFSPITNFWDQKSIHARVLLRDITTLVMDGPATAVGDTINLAVAINANKEL